MFAGDVKHRIEYIKCAKHSSYLGIKDKRITEVKQLKSQK